MDVEWLSKVCDPEREKIARPGAFQRDGVTYGVASNGHIFVAVPDAADGLAEWSYPTHATSFLVRGEAVVSRSAVLEWSGAREPHGEPFACEECGGTGMRMRREGRFGSEFYDLKYFWPLTRFAGDVLWVREGSVTDATPLVLTDGAAYLAIMPLRNIAHGVIADFVLTSDAPA